MKQESDYVTFTVTDEKTNEKLLIPIPKQMLLTQSQEFIVGLISQVVDAHFKKKDNGI
jgi:hypothetical protein